MSWSRSKSAFLTTGILHVGVLSGLAGRWPERSTRAQRGWELVSVLAVCSAGTAILVWLDERRAHPGAEDFSNGYTTGRDAGRREVLEELKAGVPLHAVARTGTDGPHLVPRGE